MWNILIKNYFYYIIIIIIIIMIIIIIIIMIIIIMMSLFIPFNTYQTLHEFEKKLKSISRGAYSKKFIILNCI